MIEVVAGVIYKENKFLIAQRNLKKAQGGLWEFPGGKQLIVFVIWNMNLR